MPEHEHCPVSKADFSKLGRMHSVCCSPAADAVDQKRIRRRRIDLVAVDPAGKLDPRSATAGGDIVVRCRQLPRRRSPVGRSQLCCLSNLGSERSSFARL